MTWVLNNLELIGELTLVHLRQSLIALVVGFVVSVPLGWVAWRYRLVRSSVITVTGLLYTIPSLALLILVPVATGWYSIVSETNLIVALAIYAVAILVRAVAEDPRFLYWADRLGLMLWGETASAYAFDPRAVTALVSEWTAVLRRDQSHPSIVAWVPLNESWGVQHIAHDARQRAFSRAVTDLTRALDGTRPVISNDGWEHTDSDIMTIHDYEADPAVLTRRYGDRDELDRMIGGFGPAGRRLVVGDRSHADRPIMLTEFGGVSLATGAAGDWGYSSARDTEAFEQQVTAILVAVGSAEPLAGFCYTQLTDTGQETNGLLYADRSPKFPLDRIRAAVRGTA